MAVAMDPTLLMGLAELDDIFDANHTTPTWSADFHDTTLDTMEETIEDTGNTIVVDSPTQEFHRQVHPPTESRARQVDKKHKWTVPPKTGRNIKLASDGSIQLKTENIRDSLTSSMMTDQDDDSSALSSLSSVTSQVDRESRETTQIPSQIGARARYNVQPRVSIPKDLAPAEYARQCIAAAENSRLASPFTLHPEEYAMLRKHISPAQVTTYLNIRNGILRLWTRNPMIRVARDEAIGCAKDTRWFDAANVCYEWLVRRGYINFGCVSYSDPPEPKSKIKRAKRARRTIAIIGAGMSGLGCARQLEGLVSHFEDRFREMGEDPPRVVTLEGRNRIGGRVYSRPFKSKSTYPTLAYGSRHTAEMGGMIITGFDRGNPMNILIRGQLALPYHWLKAEAKIHDATGKEVDLKRDQNVEQLYNYILERVSEYKYKLPVLPTADGDKALIDAGKDPNSEGTKTISEIRDRASSRPQSSKSTSQPGPQMVHVTSDKITGKPHSEPGVPAVHTASFKAREIGWPLLPGVGLEHDLDLDAASKVPDATLGSVMDAALRQYMRMVDFTPLDLRLLNWHIANLEYSNACATEQLSLQGWDLDAGNEWEGRHSMVIGGYQQVPRGLLSCPHPLNVRKKSVVKRICYDSQNKGGPSRIECADGEIVQADYIVSTVPLGVLKREKIEFEPKLPDWKIGAIRRIGYGVLNKVMLVYKEPFWDQTRDIFGALRNPPNRFSLNQPDYVAGRGRFFQWFNCSHTTGLPTLLALMGGQAAFDTENSSDDELVEEATKVLQNLYGVHKVPRPIEAVVTRWAKDEFSHGSYSYMGPGIRSDDYDVMARPIGNLFFGGEHTCGTHPATVHGAYISGLKAASDVLDTMLGPIEIPEPLILPKDTAAKRKAEAMQETQDPKQARLDAYEDAIWTAIYAKLGDQPLQPMNPHSNAFRTYQKQTWEEAKRRCEIGRRPQAKPINNEVKKMVGAMWREASAEERKPFEDAAEVEKRAFTAAIAEWTEKSGKWHKDALELRTVYEREHPSMPGPQEAPGSPWRRGRRAKMVSGYAEESASDMDLEEVEDEDEEDE